MNGLTVPRSLGLVAALAVSGTALYLVYGYKKRLYLNIRRGKGFLRLDYKAVQPSKESGVILELTGGKEVGIVEIHSHHLPYQRRAWRPPLLPVPTQEEEQLRERLAKCTADAALLKSLHTTLTSYKVTDPLSDGLEETPDGLTTGSSESFARTKALDGDSSEFRYACQVNAEAKTGSTVDSLLPASSLCPSEDDCSSQALPSKPSSARYALVGCVVSSGGVASGKTNKPKKVVRFSPSVAEPSSNNQDYRRRFKALIAQRAASTSQHFSHGPSDAIRSIAYDRPKLYSQTAKHTVTYNIHRGSRPYYPGNF